jgi:hypothetical protein
VNSQQLLYIYFGTGLFFVLYFTVFRSKPRPPTKLNLRAKSSTSADETIEAKRSEKVVQGLEVRPAEVRPAEAPEMSVIEAPKRDQRVFFVYNAHEWEAHDVLGIPHGAGLQQVTEKFQQLIKTSDSSTFEFYEAAYQSLLKKKGSR